MQRLLRSILLVLIDIREDVRAIRTATEAIEEAVVPKEGEPVAIEFKAGTPERKP